MKIITLPDPRLRQVCEPVAAPKSDRIRDLAEALEELRRGARALGLAAPQVGELARMFVLRGWPQPFINPRVLSVGNQRKTAFEGCLSIPGQHVAVMRATRVRLVATDLEGMERVFKLRGDDARAAQHELDHLDGILIVDK